MHARTLVLLSAASLGACSRDCPPGSSRQADGLCHLDDTEPAATDTATAADTADTAAPETWTLLPEGCGLSSGGPDPLTEAGAVFIQEAFFVELTDLVLSDDGQTAFAVGQGGLTIVDLSAPSAPEVRYSGRGVDGMDLRFDHVELGAEDTLYATSSFGFTVFDVSNLDAPRQITRLNASGMAGLARNGDVIYVTSSSGQLITYDISTPTDPREGVQVSGLTNPWRPALRNDRVYVADNTAGIVVYDASTPSSPALEATVPAAGGVQEVAFSADGSTLYAAIGGAGIEVFDLSDPGSPTSQGTIAVGYSVISVDTAGDLLWAANQQDVVAFDISEPGSPALLGSEQTTQWAMHVAASGSRGVVADWAYMGVYELDASISAPDLSPSSKKVYLAEGESIDVTLRNLGGAPLELLGAEGDGVQVEATRQSIGSGETGKVRLTFTGSASDTSVCLSSNDPDEPDQTIEVIADPWDDPRAGVGGTAPDFTLEDLDGQEHTLSDQLGKPVVLAYFATW